MTATAKTEALKAIESVRKSLLNGEPVDDLRKRLLAATLEYAAEQVEAIQELKRFRRVKAHVR